MRLIVSAIPSETHALSERAEELKNTIVTTVGIGYLEAALNLQNLLNDDRRISSVLFVGTAGVYRPQAGRNIGDHVVCSEVTLCDAAAEIGLTRYAGNKRPPFISATDSIVPNLPACSVATTLTITDSNKTAESIHEHSGCQLENMELFGLALVCESAKIPWNALLGITNVVGENGHKQWLQNHISVENASGRLLIDWLID